MKGAVVDLGSEATWKVISIVGTGRYFTDGELVNLYKSPLLSYLEYRAAAIYNACDTVLAPLDSFQTRFSFELDISKEDDFNLAPLSCRRDIATLGLLHRCALGKGPEHFNDFFNVSTAPRRNTRSGSRMHGRQTARGHPEQTFV